MIRYFKMFQFPNNELWWVLKSTLQGLQKYICHKNRPRAFRENLLEISEKLVISNFCGNIEHFAISAFFKYL